MTFRQTKVVGAKQLQEAKALEAKLRGNKSYKKKANNYLFRVTAKYLSLSK